MIKLQRVNADNFDDLDTYMGMLDDAAQVSEVRDHLPEIFEEESVQAVQAGIKSMNAARYFIRVDGLIVGRTELTRALNTDPSIVARVPDGVSLGYNTCYFINPTKVNRNLELAHKLVASTSIITAFIEGDLAEGLSPWLPVSLEGDDVSRGWLMQEPGSGFVVSGDEPQPGIFPQFGIGENPYSIQYATPTVKPE